jgi:hypothetical protein
MRHKILLPGLLALTACMPAGDRSAFSQPLSAREGAIEVMRGAGPPDADPSACYANESTPAVIETVTEQVMIQPPQIASDGRLLEPAVFVSESQQRIIRERRELWFQIPCEMQVGDPEFIASLQRALAARGLYQGPVHGRDDPPHRARDPRLSRATGAGQRDPVAGRGAAIGPVACGTRNWLRAAGRAEVFTTRAPAHQPGPVALRWPRVSSRG